MANQRQIAAAAGVSQTTVSRVLEGSRLISSDIRKRVLRVAKQMGYQPNMYANRLVSHIRSGKKLADKDVIAVLVESSSLKKWQEIVTYKMFYQGLCQRTQELGLKIECFLLKQPGMSTARVDHILYTRGIRGVIMAPPYIGNRSTRINWNRYASIGVGFGREEQDLNRVVFDHLSNYILAYNKLRNMGYRRIGTVLTKRIVHGNHHISQ